MKKCIIWVLLLCTVSLYGQSETIHGWCGDSVWWQYEEDNHLLTIGGHGKINLTNNLTLPWDSMLYDIEILIIEDGVENIPDHAFTSALSLRQLVLGSEVTRIGSNAFSSCVSLEEIEVHGTITYIGEEAFYGCVHLNTFFIGKEVDFIGRSAFAMCTVLDQFQVDTGNAFFWTDGPIL